MHIFKSLGVYFLAMLALLAILPVNAHAYLDPGTGSYVLQFLLAALFSSLFFIKKYWHKLISFFTGASSKKEMD